MEQFFSIFRAKSKQAVTYNSEQPPSMSPILTFIYLRKRLLVQYPLNCSLCNASYCNWSKVCCTRNSFGWGFVFKTGSKLDLIKNHEYIPQAPYWFRVRFNLLIISNLQLGILIQLIFFLICTFSPLPAIIYKSAVYICKFSKNCRENFTSLKNVGETIEIEINVFYLFISKILCYTITTFHILKLGTILYA